MESKGIGAAAYTPSQPVPQSAPASTAGEAPDGRGVQALASTPGAREVLPRARLPEEPAATEAAESKRPARVADQPYQDLRGLMRKSYLDWQASLAETANAFEKNQEPARTAARNLAGFINERFDTERPEYIPVPAHVRHRVLQARNELTDLARKQATAGSPVPEALRRSAAAALRDANACANQLLAPSALQARLQRFGASQAGSLEHVLEGPPNSEAFKALRGQCEKESALENFNFLVDMQMARLLPATEQPAAFRAMHQEYIASGKLNVSDGLKRRFVPALQALDAPAAEPATSQAAAAGAPVAPAPLATVRALMESAYGEAFTMVNQGAHRTLRAAQPRTG